MVTSAEVGGVFMGLTLAYIAGCLFGRALVSAVGAGIGALALQASSGVVLGKRPGYGAAYGASFLGLLVYSVPGILMEPVFGFQTVGSVVAFIVGCLVQSAALTRLVVPWYGIRPRFGQAMALSIVNALVGVVLWYGWQALLR
jgi:hypothetical protein